MADADDSGLLAIEVDADDYAETAADDTPQVPRTYQSEADFQAIKAAYLAKIDGQAGCSTYDDLVAMVPILGRGDGDMVSDGERAKLGKKNAQLLGYAVGEMYYDGRHGEAVQLCERVRERCEVDSKTRESLERWMQRCRERMSQM